MARSAPTPPLPPAAGGTYEVGADGALKLVQQTAEPTAEPSPEPHQPAAEDQDDAAAH